jgi:GntR family transcriptional regulator/MocR family aminotransferase
MGRSLAVKRDLLLAALRANFDAREVTWSAGTAGTHLFVRLRRLPARDAGKLVSAASRLGVRVYSGQPYFLRSPREATLILGYATVPEAEIESGVGRLARAYDRFVRRA